MSLVFVSGWAGFDYLYPNISQKYPFLVPFADQWKEENIVNNLKDTKSDILIGWSTGAHIILKHIDTIKDNFGYIILVSPFRYFLSFTKEAILNIMIENFKKEPQKVIKNFLKKINANYIEHEFNKESMLKGLIFLKESKILKIKQITKLHIIHGKKDRIVPYRESCSIVSKPIILEKTGHYLNEEMLAKLCYEITDKKII